MDVIASLWIASALACVATVVFNMDDQPPPLSPPPLQPVAAQPVLAILAGLRVLLVGPDPNVVHVGQNIGGAAAVGDDMLGLWELREDEGWEIVPGDDDVWVLLGQVLAAHQAGMHAPNGVGGGGPGVGGVGGVAAAAERRRRRIRSAVLNALGVLFGSIALTGLILTHYFERNVF